MPRLEVVLTKSMLPSSKPQLPRLLQGALRSALCCVCVSLVYVLYVYIYNNSSLCDLLFLPSKLFSVRTEQLCTCNCRQKVILIHFNVHSETNTIPSLFFNTCVTPSANS